MLEPSLLMNSWHTNMLISYTGWQTRKCSEPIENECFTIKYYNFNIIIIATTTSIPTTVIIDSNNNFSIIVFVFIVVVVVR